MAERVESINAITLITADMAASVAFYGVLECEVAFGGAQSSFTTLKLGNAQFLNLLLDATWVRPTQVWGRFILWVDDSRIRDCGVLPNGTVEVGEPRVA